MDYLSIINKYYPDDDDLRRLLLKHSRQVADRCLQIVKESLQSCPTLWDPIDSSQ